MGFFSWKCAKCGESIYNHYAIAEGHSKAEPRHTRAVLVTPNGRHVERSYEGYGVFGGQDAYEWMGDGDRDSGITLEFSEAGPPPDKCIKVLHQHCDHGQDYRDLPRSQTCPDQGYFDWEGE